jgi:hypothetical protein
MRERPILFSTPMVRAILEKRKTQTRRIIIWNNHAGVNLNFSGLSLDSSSPGRFELLGRDGDGRWQERATAKSRYGVPGDRLWVKEAAWVWCRRIKNGTTPTGRQKFRYVPFAPHHEGNVIYVADHPERPESACTEPDMVWRYKHARYMRRDLSRITLEEIELRVQRLHRISEKDACAEGLERFLDTAHTMQGWKGIPQAPVRISPIAAFCDLWESIHGSGAWQHNPWVEAVTFRRIEDAMPRG